MGEFVHGSIIKRELFKRKLYICLIGASMKTWGIHENLRHPWKLGAPVKTQWESRLQSVSKISKKTFPEKALLSAWKCFAQMREGRSGLLQIHNGMSLEIVLLIALVHGVNVSNVGDFILEYWDWWFRIKSDMAAVKYCDKANTAAEASSKYWQSIGKLPSWK